MRCSRRFASLEIDDALYADLITVLSLGLAVPAARIEGLTVPLWELVPVIQRIAEVNGLPVMEAGESGLGEPMMALMGSIGTATAPSSSVPPAGRGRMSMTS